MSLSVLALSVVALGWPLARMRASAIRLRVSRQGEGGRWREPRQPWG